MTSRDAVEKFLAEPRNVILAGVRKDGRPHLTPSWFFWDGENFYVSITRNRVKYADLRRDPRVQLVIDDSLGRRAVNVSGTVEIREDPTNELDLFHAIREKQGVKVPSDPEFLKFLIEDNRVLLVVVPDKPLEEWTVWGLDWSRKFTLRRALDRRPDRCHRTWS